MTIISTCEPIAPCMTSYPRGSFLISRRTHAYEPVGGCDGDVVPHSNLCADHGGEEDYERFIRDGEWVYHSNSPDYDPMDWACEHVRENVENWLTEWAKHWDVLELEAHRQWAIAHAADTHEKVRQAL